MSYSKDFIDRKMTLLAHEIKTPMMLIKYYAEFIKETDSAAKRAEFADSIMVLSQEMIDSSQFALDKIKDEKSPFDHVPVEIDLARFCQERIKRFWPMIQEKELQVSHNITNTLIIKADPVKIKIIVNNLLSNAIKFSPEKGKITLGVKNNIFHIADNAPTIPEEKRETIFKPYEQIQGNQSHAGFGLGLSNCLALVQNWDGKIWVKPSETPGNVFYFTLPE